jgi:hypothetical protein
MLGLMVLGFAVGVNAAAEIDETTVEKTIVVDPSGNGNAGDINPAYVSKRIFAHVMGGWEPLFPCGCRECIIRRRGLWI